MKSLIHIRRLELEDIPKVYALGVELFQSSTYEILHRLWDRYEIVELYLSDGDFCLIAENEKNELQGFLLGMILNKPRSSWKYGVVSWLGVSTAWRKRGVGTKLLEKVQELFIEEGVRMMLIDTEMSNKPAIAVFKKFGFDNPINHVYFSKNLTHLS